VFDSVWGVIPPHPEKNTAWNKVRKCFHCLGAPNNLIRPWFPPLFWKESNGVRSGDANSPVSVTIQNQTHIHMNAFFPTITDTITSHNIGLFPWITLYCFRHWLHETDHKKINCIVGFYFVWLEEALMMTGLLIELQFFVCCR